eukprot:688810-Rhodomonas_salina.4
MADRLSRVNEEAGLERINPVALPVWPGGALSWSVPPDREICELGSAFMLANLSCEPCPPGTSLRSGPPPPSLNH